MAIKSGLTNADVPGHTPLLGGTPCECLADFFREELRKHYACLERQREYYSEVAIAQVEDALARIMSQLEHLCQREDACQMMGELLRRFDIVTKLSAWTDPDQLH